MAKILVAEDDTLLSSLIANHLQKDGHEVQAAYDGPQTVEKVKELRPHLLLLDILMPIMDGFTVLDTLKGEDAAIVHMRVIILSNSDRTEDIERSKQYPVDNYLVKATTDLEEISRQVRIVLQAGLPNPQ